ncbi:YheC/YheD family protein [Thermoactinomyces sp. Gus2-1]|uniref:YheC/YheD family protein n=1 Tax=Thermoactinomyces sp. Gus2-1 TaxID=1535750 RepID=UPI000690ABB3|nr:YheC/YheD family protein [Thermoactinomyces sp. Gus2-1]
MFPWEGTSKKSTRYFDPFFDTICFAVKERIEQVGIRTARWIENQQNALLGEMSMDLGIEKDGSLWIFEANSKPMKFDEPNIRRRSLRRLIEYSLYRSRGFRIRSNDCGGNA